MKEPMSLETTAAGGALIKIFGIPVLAGAAAAALGFLIMWPRTLKEAFIRLACTIMTSAIGGPLLVIAMHSWWPTLFVSAGEVAALSGSGREMGFLFVASPFLVIAGLPAWWIVGGIVRWLDKRSGKDIAEIVRDAAQAVRDARGAL